MATKALEKTPVGLPMDLAETNVRPGFRWLPAIHKSISFLILILLSIGLYMLIFRLLQGDNDIGRTEIIIVSGINQVQNGSVSQDDVKIILRIKNKTSTTPIKRKKRGINPLPLEVYSKERNIKFKDNKNQKARKIIAEHDVLCHEAAHKDVCKELLMKLKTLTENNFSDHQENNENENTEDAKDTKNTSIDNVKDNPSTEVLKRDTLPLLRPAKSVAMEKDASPYASYNQMMDMPPYSNTNAFGYPNPQYADSCLLSRLMKPILHGGYDMYPEHQHQFSRPSSNYGAHYGHSREVDETKISPHPQDIEIAMKLIAPKSELSSKEATLNSSINEMECPIGTASCANGNSCIEDSKWCDGNVDCDDVSDESKCNCKSRVDTSRICDGYFDCPFGEDEMGCNGCDESTFNCEDEQMNSKSTCFTKEQRCNNIMDCPNHKDELDCSMLAPSLHKKPLFAVSNTEGFLHRNFKGNWYAVCSNPYMWAHDACRRETGLIIRPPYIQAVQIDPLLKAKYINTAPGGLIQTSSTCGNSSAVYVTCRDLLCGTRISSSSQVLRENADMEENLFGRNKRFVYQKHPSIYPMIFYGDQARSYANNYWQSGIPFHYLRNGISDVRTKRAESRVVGGKPSQPAAWPWMVALYRDGTFHCGGVIINQNWILSAAHCVHKFWDHYYEVQVGMLRRFSFSPQEQNHRVTHIIVNQNYNQEDMKNDLSLLRVKPGIQFSRWVRPICLPGPEVAGADWMWGPAAGTICTAVGWGATIEKGPDPDHLREVEIPIWEHCKHKEDQAGNELCAGLEEGGRDSCQGDSGGPLLCTNPANPQQWYIAGIVSHGDGCARKGEPGVYTRVSVFVSWIRYHIASKSLPLIQPKQECPGFRCDSGILKCLPKKRMCDKIIDCLDGEDEVNCEVVKLPEVMGNNLLINSLAKETNKTEETTKSLNTNDINVSDDPKPANNDKKQNVGIANSNLNQTKENTIITHETKISSTEKPNPISETTETENYTKTNNKLTTLTITINTTKKSSEATSLYDDMKYASTVEMPNLDYDVDAIDDSDAGDSVTTDPIAASTANIELEEKVININTPKIAIESMSNVVETKTVEDMKQRGDLIEDKISTSQPFEVTTLHVNTTSTMVDPGSFNNLDTHKNFTKDNKDKPPNSTDSSKQNKLHPLQIDISKFDSTENKSIVDKDNLKPKHLNGLTAIRPLDTSIYDNKTEKTMLSELQPANKRKKQSPPTEFQCKRIYQILSFSTRCDHKADCEDGSDEQDCSCTDYLTTFDTELICDGHFDCADGQDEMNCYTCEEDQFLCKKSEVCLNSRYVCDGIPQCPLGEDELNCYALSNGNHLVYDINGKPETKLKGFLTKKHHNDWNIVCKDDMSNREQEEAATHICRYLGFSSANRYMIKYINVKQKLSTIEEKRTKRNVDLMIPVHFSYKEDNDNNATEFIKDPQIIREECVPNVTRTCMALYVHCDHSLYHFNSPGVHKEIKQISDQMWPWVAKLYVDGKYRCTGILVDLSWVLVNHMCMQGSDHHFLTVLLGSRKTLKSTIGPFEQIYQIDAKKHLYRSKVTLLHLKGPATYSSMVKPMIVTLYTEDKNAICVAVGQDADDKMVNIFLKEVDRCDSHRCFVPYDNSSICQLDFKWAGLISCHNRHGWYPAASFIKDSRECVADGINGTDIGHLKYDIKVFEGKPFSPTEGLFINCEGVRCQRGLCVGLEDVCDGVTNCEDAADESKEACRKKFDVCSQNPFYHGCECPVGQLKCHNGACVPKELFKDGSDDCGDGTDEPGQTLCADYLRRVMPSRLCDGILHCHDRSDEDPTFCKCFAKKAYKCTGMSTNEDYCVAPDMVCDGVRDCPNGDDERTCLALSSSQGTPHGMGEVIARSHGVWYSKCFSTQNHSKSELEAICRELGFIGGHAKQLPDSKGKPNPYNNVIIDMFSDVRLNNNTIVKMRNTAAPIARAVSSDIQNCYPVFIECL